MTQPGVSFPTSAAVPTAAEEQEADSGRKGTAPLPSNYDVMDNLLRLASGNSQLITRPGLLQAMQANNATPQQASMINSYLTGLDASNQVKLAQATGAKISLSSQQQAALAAMGEDYSGVVVAPPTVTGPTPAPAAAGAAPGTTSPAMSLASDDTSTKKKSSGWFSSPGSFLHKLGATVGGAAQDVINPAHGTPLSNQVNAPGSSPVVQAVNNLPGDIPGMSGQTIAGAASAGLNVVQSNVSQYIQTQAAGGINSSAGFQKAAQVTQQQSAAMSAAGYDANNPFSVLAYQAKGFAHTDTADLAAGWDSTTPGLYGWDGAEAVTQAEQYLDNPTKYQTNIVNNTSMTNQQKHDLLADPRFADLVAEVGGRASTVGNEFARLAGLDPVKNPDLYAIATAGVDTAAAFAIDPINIAGAEYQAAKYSAIGLKNIGDETDIRSALDPTSNNPLTKQAVNGAQSFLKDMTQVREGLDAGTDAGETQAAMAFAHANAATPGWMGLSQDVTGARQFADATGTKDVYNVAPITTLSEFTDYLASKNGLMRLISGQAALEGKLMPGSMSRFGYRFLKGNAAAALVGKSRTLDLRLRSVLDDLTVDPENAVDEVTGESRAAEDADDAAAAAGTPPEATTLPSQARGLTAAQKGDARLASLQGVSPAAIVERARLAARRLSTNLPRNTQINLGDADGPDKILKTGLTYLSRSDANILAARFARGGEGVQKSVVDGLNQQIGHAAGLGTTEAGKALLDRVPDLNAQQYGHLGNEAIVDPGTNVAGDAAISLGQMQDTFHVLGFNDVHRASAKLGLWQHTVGRVFNNQYADIFQDYVRQAMLLKPNIGVRNMVEGIGNIATRGQFGSFVQAKAVLAEAAKSAGDEAVREAIADGVSGGKALNQVRREARAVVQTNRLKITDKAIHALAMDRVGSLYHNLVMKTMDPQRLQYMQDALSGEHADEWRARLNGYSDQIPRDALDPHGVNGASAITNDGLQPQRLVRSGYEVGPTKGVVGADRYSHALATYFGQDPDLDHALIEATQNPVHDVSGVVDAMKAPHLAHLVDQAKRAHQFTDAQGAVRYARTPEQTNLAMEQWARHYVANAKYLLSDQDGNHIQKVADYISDKGKAPNSQWLINNLADNERPVGALGAEWRAVAQNGKLGFARLLIDSGGKAFQSLVEHPIKRTTSEPAFLMNYAEQRVRLSGVEKNMADALHEAGLAPLTERHMAEFAQAPDASPEVAGEMTARHAAEVETLRTKSEKAADHIADDASYKRAYSQTESMIDDPGLKTQADVVGRNFLMFSRAVNAFARRWGGLFLEDPTRLRKLMLVNEGMHHAGFTYVDANGNVNFTYPGSDVAMKAMGRLNGIVPGLGTGVQYGLSGALTGQVNMIAPGMDNPGRFSLSPMLNIPATFLEKLAPQDQTLWDQINTALNGQDSSVDQQWFSTLVPGVISKWTAADNNDRSSALNSATVSAVMNLEASDPYYDVPDSEMPAGAKRIVPGPSSTPQDIATFLHNVQQQVKNQLYLRAAFGEFAPAAPGLPSETVKGDQADALFSASGVKNLDDEYKRLLNEAGGNRAEATAIFTANDPGRLVYTEPTSATTTNKAYLPDTSQAESWIDGNESTISKYPTVAAYFVPQTNGAFDLAAWRAQIETGLRQQKTPSEFLTSYMNTTAGVTYYASLDAKNAAVQNALLSGNTTQASAIRTAFDTWSTQFNATNPTWAAGQADLDNNEESARNQVTELTKLVDDPSAPAAVKTLAPTIKLMLSSYQNQQQWLADNPGDTAADIAMKQSELSQYEDFMLGLAKNAPGAVAGVDIGYDDAGNAITGSANPNLINLYNGVFKPLNYTPPAGG